MAPLTPAVLLEARPAQPALRGVAQAVQQHHAAGRLRGPQRHAAEPTDSQAAEAEPSAAQHGSKESSRNPKRRIKQGRFCRGQYDVWGCCGFLL